MSDNENTTPEPRKRSFSDSNSDRISSAVRSLISRSNVPSLAEAGPGLTRSNPNISPLGAGLIETPLGIGISTRLQVRNNPTLIEKRNQAERDCKNLKTDIIQWITLMKASPPLIH